MSSGCNSRAALWFLGGLIAGSVHPFYQSFHRVSYTPIVDSSNDSCPPFSPTSPTSSYRHYQIKGPLQLECMPLETMYDFTMQGQIMIIGNPGPSKRRYIQNQRLLWEPPNWRHREHPFYMGHKPIHRRQVWKGIHALLNVSGTPRSQPIWTKELLDTMVKSVVAGEDISCADYFGSARDIRTALELPEIRKTLDDLPSTMVAGSISPWVEALILAAEPQLKITTADYSPPIITDTSGRVKSTEVGQLAGLQKKFRLIVSFSSIEHDGLGRYGDPMNPNGDLAAMDELKDLLAPGGYLLLGIPVASTDNIRWNADRVYGELRLPLLLKGWHLRFVVGNFYSHEKHEKLPAYNYTSSSPVAEKLEMLRMHPPSWAHQPVLVLQRAEIGTPPFECEINRLRVVCGNNLDNKYNAT